jgi:hypothetical protein
VRERKRERERERNGLFLMIRMKKLNLKSVFNADGFMRVGSGIILK